MKKDLSKEKTTKKERTTTCPVGVNADVMPICPYCRAEMWLNYIQAGNGCGESYDEIIWDCKCMDLEKRITKKV